MGGVSLQAFAGKSFRAGRTLFQEVAPLPPVDAESAGFLNSSGRLSRTLADGPVFTVAVRCGADLATSNGANFRFFVPHGLSL